MRIEVAVLGSPTLIVFMASVGVKQHLKKNSTGTEIRSFVKVEVVDMGVVVPNNPYGLCGRKARLKPVKH